MQSVKRVILMAVVMVLITPLLVAQHEETETNATSHELHEKFKVALTLGYTHIPAAFEEGHMEKSVFVPSVGLDLFYHLGDKWSLGLLADVELKNYVVDFKREDLDREGVFILTLVAGYKILPNLEFLLGGGIEFESHKNLGVFRFGIEREISIGDGWSVAPSAIFDFKEDFNTYTLGFAIGKSF